VKKLLSILLALALCLGCAVCASAAQLAESAQAEAQSLQFELPVVTAIEAAWNGEILLNLWAEPLFTPGNVAVTVYFEEGEPEVLSIWSAQGGGSWYTQGREWFWRVDYEYDSDANSVTFYYVDTNNPDREEAPQASFSFPSDYLAAFIASQGPLTQLKLGETIEGIIGSENGCKVFTFTPAKSADYAFSGGDYYRRFVVLDTDMNVVGDSIASLKAGKTYYVLVQSYSEGEYNVTVNEYSLWRNILSNLRSLSFLDFIMLIPLVPFFLFLLPYMIINLAGLF